jgi:phospholipase/carboxylesterase
MVEQRGQKAKLEDDFMTMIDHSVPIGSGLSLSGRFRLPDGMTELTKGRINSIVIFLHGWGADGTDLAPLSDVLAQALPDHAKNTAFFTPDAPDICSANPAGRQWFELSFDETGRQKHPDFCWQAATVIHQLLDAVSLDMGVPADRIILGGFSQGGMLSLAAGPSYQQRIAGVFSLSGAYLTLSQQQELQAAGTGHLDAGFPILLVHGDDDAVVPPQALGHAKEALEGLGAAPDMHMVKQLGHSIDMEVISHLGGFLSGALSPS